MLSKNSACCGWSHAGRLDVRGPMVAPQRSVGAARDFMVTSAGLPPIPQHGKVEAGVAAEVLEVGPELVEDEEVAAVGFAPCRDGSAAAGARWRRSRRDQRAGALGPVGDHGHRETCAAPGLRTRRIPASARSTSGTLQRSAVTTRSKLRSAWDSAIRSSEGRAAAVLGVAQAGAAREVAMQVAGRVDLGDRQARARSRNSAARWVARVPAMVHSCTIAPASPALRSVVPHQAQRPPRARSSSAPTAG